MQTALILVLSLSLVINNRGIQTLSLKMRTKKKIHGLRMVITGAIQWGLRMTSLCFGSVIWAHLADNLDLECLTAAAGRPIPVPRTYINSYHSSSCREEQIMELFPPTLLHRPHVWGLPPHVSKWLLEVFPPSYLEIVPLHLYQ